MEDKSILPSPMFMIDGIKLKVTDQKSIENILNHLSIDFKMELFASGECGTKSEARYKGLRFEHYSSSKPVLYLRGCLPSYYSGLSNYANNTLSDSYRALFELADEFDLPLSTEVIKLEYGLNLCLPETITVDRFLRNILVYKGKLPAERNYDNGGTMIKFGLSEFTIKLYNKSAQHNQYTNIMRYELFIEKKAQLNRLGIYELSDLLNPDSMNKLQEMLQNVTRHLIFHDRTISPGILTRKQLETFWQYGSSHSWAELMSAKPELYRKKKKSFTDQVSRVSGINWNKLFYELVEYQSSELLASEI